MKRPVIVTGCGRSGTHWLGNIMLHVHGKGNGAFEPPDYHDIRDVVVDSRMRHHVKALRRDGHRIVHLARDGRDVVRSLHRWYRGDKSLAFCCNEWANAIDMMQGFPVVRLEDLTTPGDAQPDHLLPHWRYWDEETTLEFWNRCRIQMHRLGYGADDGER